MRKKHGYVYIVRCRGGSLYTGIARSACRRLRQHAEKSPACAKYTRSHPIESLEGLWRAADLSAAARMEYAVKRLPRGKKLELLREPDRLPELLPDLAEEEYEYQPGVSLAMCLEGNFDER